MLRAAAFGGGGIVVLAVLATIHGLTVGIDDNGFESEGPLQFFNTDIEANVPTIYSGLLLFAAAFVAYRLGTSRAGGRRRTWWAMAGFFTFMGLDEGMTIHEHVAYWVGVTWQLAYAPVGIVGFVAWVLVLRALGPYGSARTLWIGGAAAWFSAQVFERIQWNSAADAPQPHYRFDALAEEILEMTGSLLFGLALLRVALEIGALLATRELPAKPGRDGAAAGEATARRALSTRRTRVRRSGVPRGAQAGRRP